jgi:hypothetical protein
MCIYQFKIFPGYNPGPLLKGGEERQMGVRLQGMEGREWEGKTDEGEGKEGEGRK